MPKKSPSTPRSKVKNALRQLSLRSRERAQAMKNAKYTCHKCGKKQSRAKGSEVYVEAHHSDGIRYWEIIIDMILKYILPPPEKWEVLCRECHSEIHKDEMSIKK